MSVFRECARESLSGSEFCSILAGLEDWQSSDPDRAEWREIGRLTSRLRNVVRAWFDLGATPADLRRGVTCAMQQCYPDRPQAYVRARIKHWMERLAPVAAAKAA